MGKLIGGRGTTSLDWIGGLESSLWVVASSLVVGRRLFLENYFEQSLMELSLWLGSRLSGVGLRRLSACG